MTKKEIKDDLKETIKNKICEMINCNTLNTKSVGNINLKHIKNFLSSREYSLKTVLFCLNYISKSYYDWEVELKDINSINNCGRLIYLINENIDICNDLLNKCNYTFIENEDNIKLTSATDIKDYHEIAEKVGL